MHLLFLSLTLPVPPNNGHKMRTWALLRTLTALGHEVTLLSFADPRELDGSAGQLQQGCHDFEIVPLAVTNLSASGDYLKRLRALASFLPYASQRFASQAMRQRIQERLSGGGFDAVICDTVYSAVNLPEVTQLPILLNCVDVEHIILQRYLKFERNPLKQLYAWLESRRVRHWERRACRRATMGMACSDHDRALLKALCPDLPIHVVPNVVDTRAYLPTEASESCMVLYQGGMDWFPNRDAVEFFVTAILPPLRQMVPGIKFVVAGRNPSGAFRERFAAQPDVGFTGTVPDMRPVIARAAVCVVPLRIGSGTRLKILEAAAMAKPVVSTSLGAEGLDLIPGREVLLADEPKAFARAIAGLLGDARRRRRLGAAARRRVEQQYSLLNLQEASDKLLKHLHTLVGDPANAKGVCCAK